MYYIVHSPSIVMHYINRFQGLGCGHGHYSAPTTGGESTRTPWKSQLIPDQPRALRVSVAEKQWLCEGALTLSTCCHQHWCLYSRLCLPLKSGQGCCRQASDPRSGQEGRTTMAPLVMSLARKKQKTKTSSNCTPHIFRLPLMSQWPELITQTLPAARSLGLWTLYNHDWFRPVMI